MRYTTVLQHYINIVNVQLRNTCKYNGRKHIHSCQ